MKTLYKRNTVKKNVEPSEGERTLLCSNTNSTRSPSLDLGITETTSEDELIKILANILFEGFLKNHEASIRATQQGSHILPGINKRTG